MLYISKKNGISFLIPRIFLIFGDIIRNVKIYVMKYDLNTLNDYIERGLLIKNSHPTLPIDIYNYSRDCQFSQLWDDITLNMRGTVIDREGNLIAKAFPKFFNMEEHKPEDIPNEEFEVFEKMDGCCHGDTLVLTDSGWLTIREICNSDYKGEVMSYDINKSKFEYSEIIGTRISVNIGNWYEIETECGLILKLTGNHRVWSNGERSYIRVDELIGTEELLFFENLDQSIFPENGEFDI